MKVRDLVDILREVGPMRLPIVVVENGSELTEFAVLRDLYARDDSGWNQFVLYIADENAPLSPRMDTDWLKHLLDYELNDPDRRPLSFFGDEYLGEYQVVLSLNNKLYASLYDTEYRIECGKLKLFIAGKILDRVIKEQEHD